MFVAALLAALDNVRSLIPKAVPFQVCFLERVPDSRFSTLDRFNLFQSTMLGASSSWFRGGGWTIHLFIFFCHKFTPRHCSMRSASPPVTPPRPPSPRGQGVEDLTAIKKMTENAVEMEQAAERLKLLVSQVAKGTAMDKATSDNKRNDIRLAGAGLSRAYPPLWGGNCGSMGRPGFPCWCLRWILLPPEVPYSIFFPVMNPVAPRNPRELRAQSGQPAF